MRSMFSGVSGLKVHQTKMDVIGNNIANVNTVGFKSSRVTFSEIFSQTIQSATGPGDYLGGTNPMQIGLGTSISSIDVNMTEGAAQRTDNPLDLKIEGNGFFVVSDATGNKFTRAGAFIIDEAGYLVNPDGLHVMGWEADPNTKEIVKSKVKPLQIFDVNNMYVEPDMTTSATLSGNIDKNDPQLSTGSPFTFTIYDSLGYKYNVPFTITYPDPTSNPNQFEFTLANDSITDANGDTINNDTLTFTVDFQPDGTIDLSGTTTADITGIDAGFSDFVDPLTIDFSALTMYENNGITTVEGKAGDSEGKGSGHEAGSIYDFQIGTDGTIYGLYTNGDTKLIGQIVVANFDNPAGLQKEEIIYLK